MGRVFLVIVALCLLSVTPSLAKDIPGFLVGKTYSTDANQCGDIVDAEGDMLQLTKEGVYGQEFSCQFVGFRYDRDLETGRIYSVIATANCSDDSGISRPDLINLSPYEEGGQVIVQSQNEYLLGETEIIIAGKLGKEYPEKNSYAWVTNTYNLCK